MCSVNDNVERGEWIVVSRKVGMFTPYFPEKEIEV